MTHLSDAQNTGIKYADVEQTTLLAWGGIPHLMRRGSVEISIKVAPGEWSAKVLESDGTCRADVPCVYADGHRNFTAKIDADPSHAGYLYELKKNSNLNNATRSDQ